MSLEWTREFSVGVPNVDAQHRMLVGFVADLDACMRRGDENQVFRETLATVIRYTRYHFGAEEKLMTAYAYPDLVKHAKEHQVLIRTLIDFKKKFEAGAVGFTTPIIPFLEQWLLDHILRTDKPMGGYISAPQAAAQAAKLGRQAPIEPATSHKAGGVRREGKRQGHPRTDPHCG